MADTVPDFGGWRAKAHPNMRPQDAASLILVDGESAKPRFLMGKRSQGHVFLPGFYVFPGGRLEPRDAAAARSLAMHEGDKTRVACGLPGKGGHGRAKGLLHCALREASEEIGIAVTDGHHRLRYVARAITPPRHVRRYDTRFFIGRLDDLTGQFDLHGAHGDGELLTPGWFAPDDINPDFLHPITRFVIEAALQRLAQDPELRSDSTVPCHRISHGKAIVEPQ